MRMTRAPRPKPDKYIPKGGDKYPGSYGTTKMPYMFGQFDAQDERRIKARFKNWPQVEFAGITHTIRVGR